MRRAACSLLCLGLAAGTAEAFLRSRSGGGPFFRRGDSSNIQFLIHDQTAAGLMNTTGSQIITADSDPVAAIQAAMDSWTNVASSTAVFAPPGWTGGLPNSRDRQHVIYFADSPEARSAVGDAVAVTLQSFNPATGEFTDTDIIFSPSLPFSSNLQAGTYDIQTVAAHELGHALGSSHSGLLAATMFFATRRGVSDQGRLTADDIAFATEAYPEPGATAARGAFSGTVTLRGGGGLPGALVTAIDPATSVAIGALSGADGTYTISSVPPGRYFLYVEPMDGPVAPDQVGGAGIGANTAFSTVVLGGSAAPTALALGAGQTVAADFTVEGGTPALNIQNGGAAAPGAGSISLSAGAFTLSAGQSTEIAISGRGLDDTSITDATISFLGAPIVITAGSLRRGMSTSGVPSLRFLVQVAAGTPAGVATLVVRSSTAVALFSAGARISPAVPAFAANGVVNAASFAGGAAAAGEIISIFGTGLGPTEGVSGGFDAQDRLATQLADVTVTFNGVRAPLFFVRRDQINAQVPFEMAGQASAAAVVSFGSKSSAPVSVPLAAARPGIFALAPGRAIVVDPDGAVGSTVTRGRVVVIFATGQGMLNPPLATGQPAPSSPLSIAPQNVTATIGGRDARVLFAGMTPGFVGLLQVNLEAPADAPLGPSVQLVLTVDGVASQPNVTVTVQDAS